MDYQLCLLFGIDRQIASSNFNKLLDRHLGKPVQRSENAHSGNITLTIDI